MKTKKPKPTRAQLERRLAEMEAQIASTYHLADIYLSQIKDGQYMASGVMVQITALGGREVIPPTVIKDGLSPETIAALRADIYRSWELATQFRPKRPDSLGGEVDR